MFLPVWLVSAGLIAAGVFLLIQGVKQMLKFVNGPVLLTMPLTQPSGQFVLTTAGEYAIWQAGASLGRVPIRMSVPVITDQRTSQKVLLQPTFSSVRVNNVGEGRIQVFTFRAQAGPYHLTWPTDSFPSESVYSLQIRKHKSGFQLVWGILLLLVGAACLIAGLVLPVSAGRPV